MEMLKSARDTITGNLRNPKLSVDDLSLLYKMVCEFDVLESHASEIEQFCEGMPLTLVHGDFAQKNIRVRRSDARSLLLVFDWECAGWGIPAIDIARWPLVEFRWSNVSCPDISVYWSAVSQAWPHLGIEDVQRMSVLGWVFRLLAIIGREARLLATEWPEKSMKNMTYYQSGLADSIPMLEWRE
jgi:hypothetical protein